MNRISTLKCLHSILLLGFPVLSCQAEELTALVTAVKGRAQIEQGHHSIKIYPMRVLAAGQELSISEGGRLSLLCSNDSALRLEGPRKWVLSESECRRGREVTDGTFLSFMNADMRRRTRSADGWLTAPVRRSDEILAPGVLVSPRQSALLSLRPVFRWVPDPQAVEYRIEGTSTQTQGFSFKLDFLAVDCRQPFAGRTVCQAPLPREVPPLQAGVEYQIGVSSKRGRRSPWTRAEMFAVTTLGRDRRQEVERLEQAFGTVLDDVDERLRAVSLLYADKEMFSESLDLLLQVISTASAPCADDLLAASELFIESGPLAIAKAYAQSALDSASNRSIRAEALLKLGRIAYQQRHAEDAKKYLHQAAEILQELDPERQALVKRALQRLESKF